MRLVFWHCLLLALHAECVLAADILVFRGAEKEFAEMYTLLKEDFERQSIKDIVVDKEFSYEKLRAAVLAEKPKSLILLDNKAIRLAKQLRKDSDTYLANLKGVAGMGLNLKSELKDDERFCGVAYEVPGYTLVTSFRKIYGKPVQKILTLYRSSQFQREIDDARKQLEKEGVTVIAVDVEGKDDDDVMQAIDQGLKSEYKGQKVDAIWVIADNAILNPKTFPKYWLSRAKELPIPFLCGIRQFAEPKLNFCAYAASPRSEGIASQLMEMTLAIIEEGASPAELGVDYLLGTEKVINGKKIKELNLPFDSSGDQEAKVLE